MARVPLIEIVFKATSPATLVSGSTVYIYERGTTTKAAIYSAETDGVLLAQPLTTNDAGLVVKDGQIAWIEDGSYEVKVDGEDPVPREYSKGGARGEIVVNRIGEDLSAPRLDAPVNLWIAKGTPENQTADDIVIDEEGLGEAAELDVGTTAGTVAAGDDSRITGAQQKSEKGVANGYAELEAAGKVPVSQLPSAIMEYQGTWNASTNSPKLEDGKGSAGDVYRVSVAGERNLGSGSISFAVGDYVIYNGSTWEKSDTTDSVVSVNGKEGVVKLSFSDIEGLVSEAEIAEEAVGESRLKALAVSAAKIAANAIETAKIKAEAVTEGKIANLAVTAAKLAAEAVETAKIKAEAVTTAKLAEKAVTAAKIGDLGLGSIYAATGYTTGAGSNAPGAKSVCYVPVQILQPTTLTGIRYEVGTTSAGKVIATLLNSKGERVAKSAGATQSAVENFQQLAFEATLEVMPGTYWIALSMESTGTFMGAFQMKPWKKETLGAFEAPASFVPPTELNNTGAKCPFASTY